MNAAQAHLLLNHWPLILTAVGLVILIIGNYHMLLPHKKIGLTLIVIASIITVPTWLSGIGAEQVIMDAELAEHDIIETHAGFGFFSLILMSTLGIFSLVSLIMIHNTHVFFSRLRTLIVILALAAFVLVGMTAHSGGEIRHTEIRNSATN